MQQPYFETIERGPAIVNVASTGSSVLYPQAGASIAPPKVEVLMLTKAAGGRSCAGWHTLRTVIALKIDAPPMLQKYYDAAPDKDAIMSVLTGAPPHSTAGKAEGK